MATASVSHGKRIFGAFSVFFPPPSFCCYAAVDKELGCAFCSSAILYLQAFLGGVGGTGWRGEILAGWKGEIC